MNVLNKIKKWKQNVKRRQLVMLYFLVFILEHMRMHPGQYLLIFLVFSAVNWILSGLIQVEGVGVFIIATVVASLFYYYVGRFMLWIMVAMLRNMWGVEFSKESECITVDCLMSFYEHVRSQPKKYMFYIFCFSLLVLSMRLLIELSSNGNSMQSVTLFILAAVVNSVIFYYTFLFLLKKILPRMRAMWGIEIK